MAKVTSPIERCVELFVEELQQLIQQLATERLEVALSGAGSSRRTTQRQRMTQQDLFAGFEPGHSESHLEPPTASKVHHPRRGTRSTKSIKQSKALKLSSPKGAVLEEMLHRHLLRNPRQTVEDVAKALGFASEEVKQSLANLLAKKRVQLDADNPSRFLSRPQTCSPAET